MMPTIPPPTIEQQLSLLSSLSIICSILLVYLSLVLLSQIAWYWFLMNGRYQLAIYAARFVQFMRCKNLAYSYLSLTYYLANEQQQAEMVLQKWLESRLLPIRYRVMALNNLSLILQAQGRIEEALQTAVMVTTVLPHSDFGFGSLAWIHMNNGDVETALKYVQRALDEWSTWRIANRHTRAINYALYGWALAALDSQQIEPASTAVHQALQLADGIRMKPARAAVHYNAGNTWRLLGDTDAATNQYKAAVQMDPEGYYGSLAWQALTAAKPLN